MSELKITSAADYARLAQPDQGELVKMPSGAVFRMKRADFDSLLLMGAVPQTLVNVGMKAWKEQGKLTEEMLEEAARQVTSNPEEMVKELIFMRELVRDNVLEPRIGYDEVGAVALIDEQGKAIARLQSDDFFFAFSWISGKEGYSDGLERFRKGRGRAVAKTRAGSKKPEHPPEPVSVH